MDGGERYLVCSRCGLYQEVGADETEPFVCDTCVAIMCKKFFEKFGAAIIKDAAPTMHRNAKDWYFPLRELLHRPGGNGHPEESPEG